MLTRVIRIQLVLFLALTLVALGVLGFYYLRLPTVVGIRQYTLYADFPASGGLYKTANVTYRGSPSERSPMSSPPRRARGPR